MERYQDFELLLDDVEPEPADAGDGLDLVSEPSVATGPALAPAFSQPQRSSPTFARVARSLAEGLAKAAAPGLSAHLRASCSLRVHAVRRMVWRDALAELPRPGCVALVRMSPWEGAGVVSLDAGLLSAVLTRLLGGPIEDTGRLRAPTALELSLARGLVEHLLDHLRLAVRGLVELRPEVERIDADPDALPVVEPSPSVLNLQYGVSLGAVEGALGFHVPAAGLDELLSPAAVEATPATTPPPTARGRRRLENLLRDTEIDLTVRLRSSNATLSEIAELRPKSLLRLGHPASGAVQVEVEGQPLWRGVLGHRGRMRVVRIVDKIEGS